MQPMDLISPTKMHHPLNMYNPANPVSPIYAETRVVETPQNFQQTDVPEGAQMSGTILGITFILVLCIGFIDWMREAR